MKTKTSKKVLSAILAFVMIMCTGVVSFSSFAANTETVTVGDVTYDFEKTSGIITSANGIFPDDYTIPSELSGITVNGIGRNVFREKSFKTVRIPKNISIGADCFVESDINTVYFSEGCTVDDWAANFGYYPFVNSTVSKVYFCDVYNIPKGILCGALNLKTVICEGEVNSIGDNAFLGCRNLKEFKSIELSSDNNSGFVAPKGLIEIGYKSFYGTGIEKINLGSVKKIGSEAFMKCNGLTEVTIPKSLQGKGSLGRLSFAECEKLKTVHFNANEIENKIGDGGLVDWSAADNNHSNVFAGSAVETVEFGSNVNHIPHNAFDTFGYLSKIKDVTFKGEVTYIDSDAFYGINTPDIIKYAGTEAQWNAMTVKSGNEKLFACTNIKFNSKPDTDEPITIENNDAGVQVECPNNSFDNNVDVDKIQLNVEKTSADAEVDRIVKDYSLTRIPDIDVYNISLTYKGEEIQPNGKVTVRIPYSGTINDISKVKIFHYYNDKNNELVAERITGVKLINGYLEFETNHFSKFIAIKEDEQPQPSTISIAGTSLNYKSGTTLTTDVNYNGEGNYTVKYTSSNPNVVSVDDNGYVYGANKGTATITAELQDASGNTVASDSATVSVSYTWWQWLIKIVLFGWLWY